MTMHDAHHGGSRQTERPGGSNRVRTVWLVRIVMFLLLAIGAYYIIAEHRAHLLGAWPLLFLLACPLMMFFMHGGHSGHGGHNHRSDGDNAAGGDNG